MARVRRSEGNGWRRRAASCQTCSTLSASFGVLVVVVVFVAQLLLAGSVNGQESQTVPQSPANGNAEGLNREGEGSGGVGDDATEVNGSNRELQEERRELRPEDEGEQSSSVLENCVEDYDYDEANGCTSPRGNLGTEGRILAIVIAVFVGIGVPCLLCVGLSCFIMGVRRAEEVLDDPPEDEELDLSPVDDRGTNGVINITVLDHLEGSSHHSSTIAARHNRNNHWNDPGPSGLHPGTSKLAPGPSKRPPGSSSRPVEEDPRSVGTI